MWQFDKSATFSSINFYLVAQERPSAIHRNLQTVIALIAAKKLRVPQPFQVFGIHEVEETFRLFQSGRNFGKMAIEIREKDLVHVSAEKCLQYLPFDPELIHALRLS